MYSFIIKLNIPSQRILPEGNGPKKIIFVKKRFLKESFSSKKLQLPFRLKGNIQTTFLLKKWYCPILKKKILKGTILAEVLRSTPPEVVITILFEKLIRNIVFWKVHPYRIENDLNRAFIPEVPQQGTPFKKCTLMLMALPLLPEKSFKEPIGI